MQETDSLILAKYNVLILKAFRKSKMSIAELSRVSGVGYNRLQLILNKQTNYKITTYYKLCKALKINTQV